MDPGHRYGRIREIIHVESRLHIKQTHRDSDLGGFALSSPNPQLTTTGCERSIHNPTKEASYVHFTEDSAYNAKVGNIIAICSRNRYTIATMVFLGKGCRWRHCVYHYAIS